MRPITLLLGLVLVGCDGGSANGDASSAVDVRRERCDCVPGLVCIAGTCVVDTDRFPMDAATDSGRDATVYQPIDAQPRDSGQDARPDVRPDVAVPDRDAGHDVGPPSDAATNNDAAPDAG